MSSLSIVIPSTRVYNSVAVWRFKPILSAGLRFHSHSIQCKILQDFYSNDQEALWAFLRPKRLPRGFSNLIVAVVYHPDQHPNTSDAALNEYLTSSLNKIEALFPNSGILIAGDFNKFDFKA